VVLPEEDVDVPFFVPDVDDEELVNEVVEFVEFDEVSFNLV
jgi:hypothetical protein